MRATELDATDRRILRSLQEDGTIRNDVLAERVNLSPAPTLRRVRALEASGVIRRYAALLDPERIGLGARVRADIRLASQTRRRSTRFPRRSPPCRRCWSAWSCSATGTSS